MDRHLLDIMQCPLCKGALSLRDERHSGEFIQSGALDCDLCHSQFSIQKGVPCFLGPEGKPEGVPSENGRDATWVRRQAEGGYAFRTHKDRAALGRAALDAPGFVLDIASGPGLGACYYLADNRHKVIASDASWPLMQGHARFAEEHDLSSFLSCIAANAAYLPFKDDSFGAVTVYSMNDIRGEGGAAQGKAVGEVYRCLRPGSSFIVVNYGIDEGSRSEQWQTETIPVDFGGLGFITLSAAQTTLESFGFQGIRFEILEERWEKTCSADGLPLEGERLFTYLVIGAKPNLV